ncbi:hypothetical protein PR048_029041 [Dryococelus australis]|uniref:Secreted protein n=1 Tax=Dryococelus australis TaxID=614101 RepID=A0ABQ9GC87_9NEOP|nr:hypothetical protein PR048_029041 [Dryococelus australis]
MWEFCLMVTLVGGFSRGSPVSPPLLTGSVPYSLHPRRLSRPNSHPYLSTPLMFVGRTHKTTFANELRTYNFYFPSAVACSAFILICDSAISALIIWPSSQLFINTKRKRGRERRRTKGRQAKFCAVCRNSRRSTERGGAVIKHWTRNREYLGSNPGPAILIVSRDHSRRMPGVFLKPALHDTHFRSSFRTHFTLQCRLQSTPS